MSFVFEKKVLKLGGHSELPPSLPLIIHSNKEWLMGKNQLIELQGEGEEEEELNQSVSLKTVPEALELLKSIDKPVAILSICGPLRTGKSYLLSRILGYPGAFKVGHGISACTKGVWMATTVLECEEFVVVVLDTEGMDSPEEDGADVSKLMIVTTLVSSLLIYNSQTAPDWNDLEDLSCFSQLSSLIFTKGMTEDKYDAISDNFPNFLWLVRDALEPPLIDGRQVSPTEYLKSRVLVRSNSRRSTDRDEIVSAILRLFPSVECRTLPRPSADPSIVTSMEQNYDRLEPSFKEELTILVGYIRSSVRVRNSSSMQCLIGAIWAEMVEKHVTSVNSDNEIVLENMYVTAAEAALSKLSQKHVTEYKKEMEEAVIKFPMEERGQDDRGSQAETLLSIHNRIIAPKLERFQREIQHFLPSSEDDPSMEQKKKDLLLVFKSEICQLSENGAVVDGALYRFAVENYTASRHQCQVVELAAFRGVRQKIQQATTKQREVDISRDLLAAEHEYYQLAVGPAKVEVCNEVRQKLEEDSKDLMCNVPGRPKDLISTGASKDKIKLQWVETNTHPGVVDYYQVNSMTGNANWTLLSEHFPNQSAVIGKLKSDTKYLFRVRGVGITGIIGNWSDVCICSTTVGSMTRGAAILASFLGGMVFCPAAGILSIPIGGPVAIAGGIVGAPILAGALARHVAKRFGPRGEFKASSGQTASEESAPTPQMEASEVTDSPSHSPVGSGNIQHSLRSGSETVSIVNEESD